MNSTIDNIDKGQENVTFEKGESLSLLAWYRFKKNKLAVASSVFIGLLILVAIFADWVAPSHYAAEDFMSSYLKPGKDFLLGTDFLGRDLLSRIIYGARVSLSVAVIGTLTSFIVGVSYGIVSGYFGGKIDNLMMRIVDILYAVPTILFVILIMVYFRAGKSEEFTGFKALMYNLDASMGGMLFIFIGIGLTAWLPLARITRGETLAVKEREYIEAAVSQGIGRRRILFKRILPNIMGPLIIYASVEIPTMILYEAFLSFIGLGVNPPTPSWGGMIAEGIQGIRSYPHLILFPSLAMTLTVLASNFIGDGLRDALDPKLKD